MIEIARSTTFGADGRAVIYVGGPPASQRWDVGRVTIRTDSTNRTTATMHRSSISPSTQVDVAPGSGNANTSTIGFGIAPGESLIVVWTGGCVGATATVVVAYSEAPT